MLEWLTEETPKENKLQEIPSKKDFPQTEENLKQLRQQIFHDLQNDFGLDPHYIDWLETEKQCEQVANKLPLVYVWKEGHTLTPGDLHIPKLSIFI